MRVPSLITVAGVKGAGKSFITWQELLHYVKGDLNGQPRKVLIVDVNDEYEQVKSIPIEYVPLFSLHPKVEMRRILPVGKNGTPYTSKDWQDIMIFLLKNFTNGLLLLEDTNTFIADNFQRDFIGQISKQRHFNLDIIMHFQSIGRLFNKKLIGLTTLMRLHHVTDNSLIYKDALKSYFPIVRIAEILLEKENDKLPEGKKYYFLYVNPSENKIIAHSTDEMKLLAITDYIYENYSVVLKPYLLRAKRNGNNKTEKEILEELKINYLKKFF